MQAETILVVPPAMPEQIFVEITGCESNFFPKFVTDATFSENLENFWRKSA